MSKILKDQKKQGKSKKWYNGNKWWQKEEGAKCHQKKKEKFKVEPKKYVLLRLNLLLYDFWSLA